MKRYQAIHKLTDNPFLNLYEIDALTKSGSPFHYYFASRNQENKIKTLTHALDPEGIVIYAVTKELPHHLVMIRQYRYPMDDYLYELPAGLVDPGEEPQEAARREMKEETGYNLMIYSGGDECLRRPFYMAQGLTDETSTAVYGYVEGCEQKKALEDSEDIEVLLVDKEKARKILANEKVSLRAAFFLMAYIRSKPEHPFDFLDILTI